MADQNAVFVPETFNIVRVHLDENVKSRGTKVAIHSPYERWTYIELDEQVSKSGNVLLSCGVSNGDRILLALPDIPQVASLFLGAMKIGAVPSIINPAASSSEMKYFVEKSEAKFLATTVSTARRVSQELGKTRLMTLDGEFHDCVDYQKAIKAASSNLETYPTKRTDPAYVVFSSGTTGNPKAVLHLHKDLLYTVYPFLSYVMSANPDDVYYSASRLFFSAGRMFSLHLPLMSGASTVLIAERPTPEIILKTLAKFNPTVFLAVPSVYSSLLRAKESEDIPLNISSIRLCLSGGEPLSPLVYEKWKKMTNMEIFSAVGSSEAEWHFISQFQGKIRPESSGKIIPGWQIKLVDDKGNLVTQPSVLGTAWLKSESVAAGYLNDPENTEKKFVDGWFNTNDVFYFDSDGYFYYVGRNDSLFKVKGRWIFPLEIENVLMEHSAVSECVVFCAQDSEGLNSIRALIVLKGDNRKKLEELARDILEFASQRLDSYKMPRDIGFVDSIEKTSNGKIRRADLGNTKVRFHSLRESM